MKKFYEILVSILFLSSFQLFAQEVYSEMPFIVDNGIVKCKRIVVAFNQNVIPTTSGVTVVDTSRFPIQDECKKTP